MIGYNYHLWIASLLLWIAADVSSDGIPRSRMRRIRKASAAADAAHSPNAPSYGKRLLEAQFLLNYSNFNHGSFGACPKFVLDYQAGLQLQQEQQPDTWFRERHYQLQNQTRENIARYVGAYDHGMLDGLVLVESASTAVNSIMRSFPWNARTHTGSAQDGNDIIAMFSVAYPMVKNTAEWLSRTYGLTVREVAITFPVQGDWDFLDAMQTLLKDLEDSNELARLKMVILDHIVSTPAIKEPVAKLAAMIKDRAPHTFVLVDGAHAMGQVRQLNLEAIGNMDAYLSNGHKWLYSPKGSAFLWVNQTSGFVTDKFPEPTVVSSANAIGATALSERYSYVSSRDYTAFLAMDAALTFRQRILGGEENIYQYCRALAVAAKNLLMDMWNHTTALAPDDMEEFMINIGLPLEIDSNEKARAFQAYMLKEHGVYMLTLHEQTSGTYYTRLSAQVYLDLWDFEHMGKLVMEYVKQQYQHHLLERVDENDGNHDDDDECNQATAVE